MKKTDKILFDLIYWVRKLGNEVVIPNFYVGSWEMDLFRLLPSEYLIEYEIKTSRGDFRNDFKKSTEDVRYNFEEKKIEKSNFRKKHDEIQNGNYIANKFFFVVPRGMVKIEEIPEKCGLIYYDDSDYYPSFEIIKPAKFIHKNKFSGSMESLLKSLCYREFNLRIKVKNLIKQNRELKQNNRK